MGVLSPLGNTLDEFWGGLTAGKSGVTSVELFEQIGVNSTVGGLVKDFNPVDFMSVKDARKMANFVKYAIAAGKKAFENSGIDMSVEDPTRIGVLVGSGIGGIDIMEEQHRVYFDRGASRISPFLIPMLIVNMAPGQISIHLGLKGPNLSVATACATATHAIGESFRIIKHGDAEVMVAGGTEAAMTALGVGGFSAMHALSSKRNSEPEKASRPFDADRDGFVMGEGAGIVVLETLEHARKRNANIYCEVIGYGLSGDAYHMTAPSPDGEGAARCMQMAVENAGINPEEVDYINAHGTSTQINDRCETRSIKTVFKDHAKKLCVNSTKSMTGHLLGAAGGVEAIACALTLKDGIVHPTINYEYPDPECDLDYVPNEARKRDVKIALSNSLGFGGHNTTLAFKKI